MNPNLKFNHTQELTKLFLQHFGKEPNSVSLIPPSGSDRVYYIFKNGDDIAVGAYNPDLKENRTFFYFSELFLKYNLPVPKIYKKDQKGYYLIEYLEGKSLLECLQLEGHSERVKQLFKGSLDYLVMMQVNVLEQMDFTMCHAAEEFDMNQIFSDLMYFKHYYLDLHKISYPKYELMDELAEMAKQMASVRPVTFMYRDFQSRNILVNDKDELSFIDYQGGMKGIPQYDVVSLLWQARAELPSDWKRELINHYFSKLQATGAFYNLNEIEFRKTYLDCILLRIMQTLGAYGFRGLIERKEHFLQSITPALKQLNSFLEEHPRHPSFPELRKVLEIISSEHWINNYSNIQDSVHPNADKLKINVYSFSFKKGTAKDPNGNGGGFIFDCRGILNPGRINQYKQQTGKDKEVIEYLEQCTQMPTFLENIKKVIDFNIKDYLERGFEHLSISFGCTGGQHRSVYAAEQVAKYITEKYKINSVELLHLEQTPNDKERAYGGI